MTDFFLFYIFSTIFEKYSSYFTKIPPGSALLFHADGRTDGETGKGTCQSW